MKHLKTFENLNKEPKIGDYVICKIDDNTGMSKFFNNNIGRISQSLGDGEFCITYKANIYPPATIGPNYSTYVNKNNIIHHSENIENLKWFIDSKKFNL